MAYEKQGFTNGMILEAANLIAMEDGIIALEEYVDGEEFMAKIIAALPRYNGEVEDV